MQSICPHDDHSEIRNEKWLIPSELGTPPCINGYSSQEPSTLARNRHPETGKEPCGAPQEEGLGDAEVIRKCCFVEEGFEVDVGGWTAISEGRKVGYCSAISVCSARRWRAWCRGQLR